MTAQICPFPRRHTAALLIHDDDETSPAYRLRRCADQLAAMSAAGELDALPDDTRGLIDQLPLIMLDIAGQVR